MVVPQTTTMRCFSESERMPISVEQDAMVTITDILPSILQTNILLIYCSISVKKAIVRGIIYSQNMALFPRLNDVNVLSVYTLNLGTIDRVICESIKVKVHLIYLQSVYLRILCVFLHRQLLIVTPMPKANAIP